MNNNVDQALKIFDAFEKFSEAIHLQDQIRRKQEDIGNLAKKNCGNCTKWMTDACPNEYYVDNAGNRSTRGGMRTGPSCNGSCGQFNANNYSITKGKELQQELIEFIEKNKTH